MIQAWIQELYGEKWFHTPLSSFHILGDKYGEEISDF